MPLRIVSWNCNMALRPKFEALRTLRPDVAIIQECAAPASGGVRHVATPTGSASTARKGWASSRSAI